MGPILAVPPLLRELGPHWERAKRPMIGLLLALLAIVAALWWLDTQ